MHMTFELITVTLTIINMFVSCFVLFNYLKLRRNLQPKKINAGKQLQDIVPVDPIQHDINRERLSAIVTGL